MHRRSLLNLINRFAMNASQYNEAEGLSDDIDYLYYYYDNEIKKEQSTDLKQYYDKLVSMIGTIKLKYGYESTIIKDDPDLKDLKIKLNKIKLSDKDLIQEYNNLLEEYLKIIDQTTNVDFIKNNYENDKDKKEEYQTIESLKKLVISKIHKDKLNENIKNDILIDCLKLNENSNILIYLKRKYKDLINE